jgi:hypothetical protein
MCISDAIYIFIDNKSQKFVWAFAIPWSLSSVVILDGTFPKMCPVTLRPESKVTS